MSPLSPLPGIKAKQRHQEKSMLVLRFLRTVTYSTTDILADVLSLSKREHVVDFLEQMEQANVITHREFAELGGRITLWGITATGQDRALRHGEEPNQSAFNPSKISITNLLHYLAMQRIHVLAERVGWTDFVYVDRYRRKQFARNMEHARAVRPDLLTINPAGYRAAIECERTRKSMQRYKEEVIPGHVRALNAHEYDFVLWITRTPADQSELFAVINKVVGELRAADKWNLLVPAASFKRFQFANLTTWPTY
jgi:hypothetical protein